MSKRITMISFMDKTQLDKVEKLMNNIPIKTCKVLYGINDENRYNVDNLPYHFTIFATNKENQDEIIKVILEQPILRNLWIDIFQKI